MSTEELSLLAGIVLSFLFEYAPGLATWYSRQEKHVKRLVMAGVLLVTAVGIFLAGCQGLVQGVECSSQGLWGLLWLVGLAIASNQGAYGLLKRKGS